MARNTALNDLIAKARHMRVEGELMRRGFRLKRRGAELRGPCPICGGDDRFVVTPRKNLWHCRQCAKGGGIIDLAMWLDGYSFKEALRTLTGDDPRPQVTVLTSPAPKTDDEDHERKQRRTAAWLWSQRRPVGGTIAEKYLREVRGITCPLPATLGFLPANNGHSPAMISAYAIPDEPEPGILGEPRDVDSVHLTKLLPDGSGKANVENPKITIGRPLGRPIVLAPANDLLGIAITEGIENALSVHEATGLGAWAAGSAVFMPALANTLPDYIEAVTICADSDKVGQDNARRLAEALSSRRIEIFIKGSAQ
jgi:hypothetical protein